MDRSLLLKRGTLLENMTIHQQAACLGAIGSWLSRYAGEIVSGHPIFNSFPGFVTDFKLPKSHRTMMVLSLVDIMFDISSSLHSYTCDGSLLRALPLPCGRNLWRASTRAKWGTEYAAQRERIEGRKRLTYGDLMNFHLRPEGTLDPWLSQLDDFGTLVMAAASM